MISLKSGFLLIQKESNISSHATLRPLKKLFQCKIGHTGTLDPMATGMLVCAIGEARKFIQYTQQHVNKCYEAVIQLGQMTDTSDITGETIKREQVNTLSTELIEQTIQTKFIGNITQTPPIYSALKYQGKPYYYYARRNESIPIKARDINVFWIKNIVYDQQTHQIKFKILVSSGTYIRSLAVDIAKSLGTIGCLAQLKRIYVDPWHQHEMYPIETICASDHPENYLLSIDQALPNQERIILSNDDILKLKHGIKLPRAIKEIGEKTYIVVDEEHHFHGLAQSNNDKLKPLKMLHQ